ncbi:MAG TPA: hypothetical protein V6C57_03405 [Coleofasciculaceae cyanobacterium]
MIHHISIAAQNPLYVATVLAEVWNGKVFKFPYPGSYVVFPFDNYGSGIEVFPLECVMVPASDTESSKVIQIPHSSGFVATHAAISVPASQAQLEQIGKREGWQVARCNRGPFDVIEFWLENRLMLEFLPPDLTTQYLQAIQPQIAEQVFGQPVEAIAV